jgi:iron complex outermembrane recepter protein
MMFKRNRLALAVATAFGTVASIGAANAQTTESIEITGSRIRSVDRETAQPILTVTREEIQKSGLVTVGDIVNALTTAGSPAFSKGSALVSNREQGGQYADMRNLGSQRVLVLVNGKRWMTSINGFTDMSTIPSSLVDRVEVLKDGASAIYGSDAIAGVVNFILKRRFEGGEANLYYGANEKGDGRTQQYDFTFGASGDKGSLIANVSVAKQGEVWAKSRDITRFTFGPDHYNANFGAAPWGRIQYVNPANGLALTGAGSINQMLNHTGTYDGVGVGSSSRDPANYHAYAGAEEDTYNSSQDMHFQTPSELKALFVKGDYSITDNVRVRLIGMYSERESERQIAGYPLNSRSQPLYPVYIDKDSYYNPYGNAVAGAGNGRDLYFTRRTIEVPRVTVNNLKSFHFDGGLEGSFMVAGKEWNWDAGVNYNKGDGTVTGTGNLNLVNLKRALGPSFVNAQGAVQCGTAASPIAATQCVPFDILGGPSASTAEALKYVMANTTGTYNSTITSYTANITGGLFKLPAGDLSLAAGGEYRKVSGFDHPDALSQNGYTTDLAANPTDADFNIKEAYAELEVPILKGVVGADLLTVNLASRFSDYSNFGSTTNSKASLRYKPVKDLLVRGTWAQGFRAPTLGDVFGGGQQTFDSYLDPCDSVNGEAANTPEVAARCAAAGVPAGFRQVNQAGNPVGSGGAQGIAPFNAGAGNASLEPETALTKTVGFVFSPSQVPGLSMSVDWWKIEVSNAITAISAGTVLNRCYVSNDPTFCTSIVRDPSSGMVTYLERGNLNLAAVKTDGLDVSASYQLPAMAWGNLRLNLDATYLRSFKTKSSPEAEWATYNAEWPYYRLKANLAMDWALGNWSARFMTRYYGGTKDQCWDSATECSNPGQEATWGTDVNYKKALVYNDLNVAWKTPWKGTIAVGANNLFDKKPRINYQTNSAIGENGTSSSSSVDPDLPIDRFFYLRYSQTF